jgi:hypothetical protein
MYSMEIASQYEMGILVSDVSLSTPLDDDKMCKLLHMHIHLACGQSIATVPSLATRDGFAC